MLISPQRPTATGIAVPDLPDVGQHLLDGSHFYYAYLRRRLACPDEAEDALQDFRLKAIQAAHTLAAGEKINAWLGRILRNTLVDHYRRRAVRQRAETAYTAEAACDQAEMPSNREQRACQCLPSVLRRLRPDYAEILRLADLEELPRDKVAATQGLTVNNVNVRLHRARLALKAELERSCSGCRHDGYLACDCEPSVGARRCQPHTTDRDTPFTAVMKSAVPRQLINPCDHGGHRRKPDRVATLPLPAADCRHF